MQVQRSSRQLATEQVTTMRKSALNMYSNPPEDRISLTEFEDYAFDRLRREHQLSEPTFATATQAALPLPAVSHGIDTGELLAHLSVVTPTLDDELRRPYSNAISLGPFCLHSSEHHRHGPR